jgi:hypothetical protein
LDDPSTVTSLYSTAYYATINMKGVTSPVNMADPAATHYPQYKYEMISVNYSTISNIVSSGSDSNGGTYVLNVEDVSTQEILVGKLAATITGVVAGCSGADFFNNVGTGYTVKLTTNSSPGENSGSGNLGNVVMTATTDASGAFTFSNVESGEPFMICAGDANSTMYGCADGDASTTPNYVTLANVEAVTAPYDGQTKTLTIQGSTAVHACSTDVHGPSVVQITPEVGSDNTPGATTVKFKFSEPVLQSAKTTTIAGIPGNIYDTIEVGYLQNKPKAGNIAHTLNWNAAFDELSVTLTTMPAGMFYVRIADIETTFTDAVNNAAEMGACPDDVNVPGVYGLTPLAGTTDCTAYFTSNGATTATAPTSVIITNLSTLDATGTSPTLDWIATTGSKSYRIYKKIYQWPGYPVAASGAITTAGNQVSTEYLVASTLSTALTDTCGGSGCDFIEGDNIPLAVTYTVKGVNADGIETATGASANASDRTKPKLGTPYLTLPETTIAANDFKLTFNEDMDETKAETTANYSITAWSGFTAPSMSNCTAQYIGQEVTIACDNLGWSIVAGPGLCLTAVNGSDSPTNIATGGGAACVQRGTAGADPTCSGADIACGSGGAGTATYGCCAAADNTCDTAPVTGNTLITAVGSLPICITAGTDKILQSTPTGPNYAISSIQKVTASSNVTDVAGNAMDTTADEITVNSTNVVQAPQ